jgi:hypothetical protein
MSLVEVIAHTWRGAVKVDALREVTGVNER